LDVKAVANTPVANGISAVPVVAIDGSIVGIISEGDLMRRMVASADRKRSRWLEIFSSLRTTDGRIREVTWAQGGGCDDASGDQCRSRQVVAEIANLLETRRMCAGLPLGGTSPP
jgi:CBS domain-containing protein